MDTGLAPCPTQYNTQHLNDCMLLHAELRRGLKQSQKRLPSKLFYDDRGSKLFDAICELPEYYVTRTEQAIMQAHIAAICAAIGPGVRLVELGSGSSLKTRLLLDHLEDPAYVPVDISGEYLLRTAAELRRRYPGLRVDPLIADFTTTLELPPLTEHPRPILVYFPGSTIGNFAPHEARMLLRRIHALCGRGGSLLLGIDLRKPREVLEPAYDDAAGVTAEFNLNLLRRLNHEFGGDFVLDTFRHRAVYEDHRSRVEMHLVSQRAQAFHLLGERYTLHQGETLHTENSYKYSTQSLQQLAQATSFRIAARWTDPQEWFAVQWWRAID